MPLPAFPSRRSVVMACRGMIATSQPLATQAGLDILKRGGNAIDAAVAAAFTLGVVEPLATGIGGDAFILYYKACEHKLYGVNGSGRCPKNLSLDVLKQRGHLQGHECVTVPGAVDAFWEALQKHGQCDFSEVLKPAIDYAENGFPVSEIIARQWKACREHLLKNDPATKTYLTSKGQSPEGGSIHRQVQLAQVLRAMAEGGRDAFYRGDIAKRIVAFSQATGGFFTLEDFASHTTDWVEPICTDYRNHTVVELPPNGQGITALMALNILEGFDIAKCEYGSSAYYHLLIEATKQAFADRNRYVADPDQADIPVEGLLSKSYAKTRRREIDLHCAKDFLPGSPPSLGDTVYVSCVDSQGNVVSLINSLFHGFGSGIVAGDTGICLHNRGLGFSCDPRHPNALKPGKRPFHTIIPALILKEEKPWLCYGVMGGDMQAQGHVQVAINMIDFHMNVQQALDAPRYRFMGGRSVALEPNIPASVRRELGNRGHKIHEQPQNVSFGGGQAIFIDRKQGVLHGGSDPRKDGNAAGY